MITTIMIDDDAVRIKIIFLPLLPPQTIPHTDIRIHIHAHTFFYLQVTVSSKTRKESIIITSGSIVQP